MREESMEAAWGFCDGGWAWGVREGEGEEEEGGVEEEREGR